MSQKQLILDFINKYDQPVKSRLIEMLEITLSIVPDAEMSLAYGMPAFKLNGKPLIYFNGYDHHIGFYATPNGHQEFKAEFAEFKQGKGSVQFPNDQPLPVNLVKRVIEFRKMQCQK